MGAGTISESESSLFNGLRRHFRVTWAAQAAWVRFRRVAALEARRHIITFCKCITGHIQKVIRAPPSERN